MSWDTIRAEEYCESVRDGTHDTPKPVSNGYKLVTGKHIQNGQIDPTDAYFISENDYRKINERSKVEKWDVLMSMIGNGLGRSAVVKKEPDYAIKNIALFKVGDEKKAKWLHYYLSSPQGQGFIYNSLQGSGQPFISLSFIRDFPIPTPPLPYLNKAVSILEIYDDLIENNQKQIKLLEEAAQRLYKEWFVDLRFPNYENTPVVDGMPEGWRIGRLDELGEFKRGKTITKDSVMSGNVPVVAGGLEPAYFHNTANTVAPVITVSGSGANAGFTRMYHVNVWASDCSFIDSNTTENIYMIYCYLKANKADLDRLQKGAAQPHVYAKDINAMTIMIANNVLLRFNETVSPIFTKIGNLFQQIEKLKEARDRLLPKLMSGELEV